MPPKVFLDTSALFAGIWSTEGGARLILKLGTAGAIQLLVSRQVLEEIEAVFRRKKPALLGALALVLDQAHIQATLLPEETLLQRSQALINHAGDANILAAAWTAQVDYLVTLDRKHFLENRVVQEEAPFPIGTPGDFIAWYRRQFGEAMDGA